MKKKKLITMLTTLVLVAVVGVGATLAYFTDTTQALKNTFTVGNNVSLELRETKNFDDETGIDYIFADFDTENGLSYTNMLPGVPQDKDPYVVVGDGSSDCYLFIKLTDFDDKLNIISNGTEGVVNTNWIKLTPIDNKIDGIYMYQEGTTTTFSSGKQTVPVFDQIKLKNEVTEHGITIKDLNIEACAYQSRDVDFDEVIAKSNYLELQNLFNNN